MKLYIQFYIIIVLFCTSIYCEFNEKAQTREHHAIDNSGINRTCKETKFNPCKHESQCYYTNITSEYFCKCNECYSGQFCQDKVCTTKNQNTTEIYHTVLLSDYIYTSIVGIIYILAFFSTLKLTIKSDKYQKEILSGQITDNLSVTVNSTNSIVQNIASNLNVEERKKNLELEDFLINNDMINEFDNSSSNKNNNHEKQEKYDLWDELKMKLKINKK
ncbi:Epidermal growth factor-like domain-containing protein [Strongyloides ratti]|uniref:Epidermal growth factor-like domain-containing protein n=1 Tax=Strongyloides ratti TaxID=34506 RepID=A0A090MYE5_STRRB|nr:Epidermal growth factor-like domain-containing protein [Strongyloides ratti]CEF67044.1 Epidermal growth factor-like domain-containing protein [Strongyloides ratti]